MAITVRSFAKINLGLRIGALRPDGFHALRTVYQTVAIHDMIQVRLGRGDGIQIQCDDPRVPTNEWNTCYRVVERALTALNVHRRVTIEIDKRLPVQGGLGGASGNAIAALLALELAIHKPLSFQEKLRIGAEVGSDLPLFLIGGTILGAGRGEEVYPVPDLPASACVIAMPDIAVSTPKAFADWDLLVGAAGNARPRAGLSQSAAEFEPVTDKLTHLGPSDRMLKFGYSIAAWLSGFSQPKAGLAKSGVPASGRGRAETPLLDLVRTGIENDFERVVFSQYPELREVKRLLEQSGAKYASLSGSGSALYGLFASSQQAAGAAAGLRKAGVPAVATSTMTRQQYWRKFLVSRS
jgi:4-diphosphocytidyl-2-C-methyl-D-erythritol kinase